MTSSDSRYLQSQQQPAAGWLKIPRQVLRDLRSNNAVVRRRAQAEVLVQELAAYAPHVGYVEGERVVLERGQFAFSLGRMERLDLTLGKKSWRNLLEEKVESGEWTLPKGRSTKGLTIVQIVNYFGDLGEEERGTPKGTPEGTPNDTGKHAPGNDLRDQGHTEGHTEGHSRDTGKKNEGKNEGIEGNLPPAGGGGKGAGNEGPKGKAKKATSGDDDPEFVEAWSIYPKRPTDSRKETSRAWSARKKDGATGEALLAGAKRYADYIARTGKQEFAMGAAKFFGPGEYWQNPYTDDGQLASGGTGAGGGAVEFVDTAALEAEKRRAEEERHAEHERQMEAWAERLRVRWEEAPQEVKDRLTAKAQAAHEVIRGMPGYDRAVRAERRTLFAAEIGEPQPNGRAG